MQAALRGTLRVRQPTSYTERADAYDNRPKRLEFLRPMQKIAGHGESPIGKIVLLMPAAGANLE